MKVKCIGIGTYKCLTLGKTYDVIDVIDEDEDYWYYIIINDKDNQTWYEKEYFKPISKIRNETIDKLLSDES